MEGKPWNEDKTLVKWNGTKWETNDVPDFVASSTAADGTKTAVAPNNKAFMMRWEQNACFLASGMKDMPIPEFFEPFESPTDNVLNGRQNSPLILFSKDESVQQGDRRPTP